MDQNQTRARMIGKLQMALKNLRSQGNSKANIPLLSADFLLSQLILISKQSKGKRISSKLLIDSALKVMNTSKAKRLRFKMTQTTSSVSVTL